MKKNPYRGTLKSYLRWPILLTPLLIIMNLNLYLINMKSGLCMSLYLLIYVVLAYIIFHYKRPLLLKELIGYSIQFNEKQERLLKEMALPIAILDDDGNIAWYNDEFSELYPTKKLTNVKITQLIPSFQLSNLPTEEMDEEVHFEIDDRFLKGVFRRIHVNENNISDDLNPLGIGDVINMLYIYDETEMVTIIRENHEQRLSVGLLYIDNFEESLESIDEVRQSLLVALIDRKINKYMQGIDAIIKKIEKDKYIFVFQHKYLQTLQNNKFSLLNEIRSISIGNEIAVTISMGIGTQGDSYSKRYEYARTAIDLALGRGGDQVVVKNPDNLLYYGGKSMKVEKNTRVKARVKAHALKELVEASEQIVVMGHTLADVDALGAALGVYRISKTLGKTAHIVINEISSSIRPVIKLFQNNPDYEEDLFITSEKARNLVNLGTLLVVVDVNKPSYTECPDLLQKTKTIVILDHHRQTGEAIENPVLSYIEPYASSSCEMVAEILQYVDDGVKLKPIEADAMYAGITVDTNNFMNKTGVRTFEAVAYLRRNGADMIRIRKMFRTDMKEYQVRAEAIQNTKIFMNYYAISMFSSDGVESPTIIGAKIANELLDLTNIKASFVLTKYNNKIYISARSIDELNVQIIMERLGGGGHLSAAGAQLENCTLEEASDIVCNILKEMKEEGDI